MALVTTNSALQKNVTTIGSGYHNVFYEWVLLGLKSTINNEFKGVEAYIAPEIKPGSPPFSIRIWGSSADLENESTQQWQKRYNIDVCLYSIEKNASERFYQQFYADSERMWQLLFNNKTLTITQDSDTSGGAVSVSKSFTWIGGTVGSIEYNEYEGEEDDIDGLHKVSLDFSCLVEREG